MQNNSYKCLLRKTLVNAGIYDWAKQQKSIYIGGSLVSYLMCHNTFDDINDVNDSFDVPHDVDIYTINHVSSINSFNMNINKFTVSCIEGCIINFTCVDSKSKLHLQFITAEADDFYNDVLGNYDCDLVCVGYHPYDDELILHKRYLDACENHSFNCYKHLSSISRSQKLEKRIQLWYNGKINFIGDEFGRIDAYYGGQECKLSKSVLNMIMPPKYIQLFYNLYKCISCGEQNKKLLCQKCSIKISDSITSVLFKSAIVLGGCNGFGKIIGDVFESRNVDVTRTSRFPNKENELEFVLGLDASSKLMDKINTSDILIMNATKTLDGDEVIWNHYLDDFDQSLLFDRVDTNVCGYVKFLDQICQYRIHLLHNNHKLNNLVIVYTDANESKFDGKMTDCKHLELNIAKAGVKQIFYTNSSLFAKLNIITICYDPGWLSYHGISIEKKRAKSSDLIPPNISALGILSIVMYFHHEFQNLIEWKKIIFDYDVYKFINSTLRKIVIDT